MQEWAYDWSEEFIKFNKSQKLKKANEELEKEIRSKGNFPFTYTCQRCNRLFVIEEECKIIDGESPICPICKGEIKEEGEANGG